MPQKSPHSKSNNSASVKCAKLRYEKRQTTFWYEAPSDKVFKHWRPTIRRWPSSIKELFIFCLKYTREIITAAKAKFFSSGKL
jgi:hypothetical protein